MAKPLVTRFMCRWRSKVSSNMLGVNGSELSVRWRGWLQSIQNDRPVAKPLDGHPVPVREEGRVVSQVAAARRGL